MISGVLPYHGNRTGCYERSSKPTLVLDDYTNDRSTRKVLALVRWEEPSLEDPGLGYRGFLIHAMDELVDGYDELRLYCRIVSTRLADRTVIFIDSNKTFEMCLLEFARDHVDARILEYVRDQIRT